MVEKITEQEKKELAKIRRETEVPKQEERLIPLIKNNYKINGKTVSQYKINIPKKFADFLNFDKGEFKVKSILDKKDNKIIFEVTKDA